MCHEPLACPKHTDQAAGPVGEAARGMWADLPALCVQPFRRMCPAVLQ